MGLCICAVKYVNGGTGVCVIRSSRKQYRMIWAAITFITEIRNLPLSFNLLDLSGKNRLFSRLCNAKHGFVTCTMANFLYRLGFRFPVSFYLLVSFEYLHAKVDYAESLLVFLLCYREYQCLSAGSCRMRLGEVTVIEARQARSLSRATGAC